MKLLRALSLWASAISIVGFGLYIIFVTFSARERAPLDSAGILIFTGILVGIGLWITAAIADSFKG